MDGDMDVMTERVQPRKPVIPRDWARRSLLQLSGVMEAVVEHEDSSTLTGDIGSARSHSKEMPSCGRILRYGLRMWCTQRYVTLPSDMLVMAPDVMQGRFGTRNASQSSARQITALILARYSSRTDDAHFVIAHYLGAQT